MTRTVIILIAFIVSAAVQETFAFSLLPYLFASDESPFSKSDEGPKSSLSYFKEPWSFSTGLAVGKPFEYLNEDGNLRGFHVDLVEEICKEAGKECVVMFDNYNNCYQHEESGQAAAGPGLLGRWYDGCLSFLRVPKRVPVVDFSVGLYTYTPSGRFYVLQDNPDGFDPFDVTGKRIGFLSGWAADERCLDRDARVKHFDTLQRESKVYLQQEDKLVTLLKNKQLNAVFFPRDVADGIDGIVEIGPDFECDFGNDNSMRVITRKGSSLLSWFDQAFERIKENGRYDRICHKAEAEHGGNPYCL